VRRSPFTWSPSKTSPCPKTPRSKNSRFDPDVRLISPSSGETSPRAGFHDASSHF
jgi:hypothetical protein